MGYVLWKQAEKEDAVWREFTGEEIRNCIKNNRKASTYTYE